jgi:hypothetical protein
MSIRQWLLFLALLIEFCQNLTIADEDEQRFDGWYNNRNRYDFGSTIVGKIYKYSLNNRYIYRKSNSFGSN